MNKKYYFTFGTSDTFPFKKGWIEVHAETKREAVEKFNAKYPPRYNDVVNCAFIYSQDDFEQSEMFQKGTWGRCHEVIS